MIQHFKFKPLYENSPLPGWIVNFYNDRIYYEVVYNQDGSLNCLVPEGAELSEDIKKDIHALMSFHVYD